MTKKIKSVLIAVFTIGALADRGATIAGAQSSETPPEPSTPASGQAVENESVEQVSGPQANEAALDAVGGGTVLEIEGANDGASGFEAEIEVADGSQIEVNLDANLNVVSPGTDD